jgi:hypothetical protein
MSKALRRTSTLGFVFAWGVLLAMVAAYGYELWQHPFVVGILSVIVSAVVARNRHRTKRHLAELARERIGESICEFSRAFDVRNTDTWVIRAVYEQIQEQLRWVQPDFPVRATDRLVEDLRLDPDDIDLDVFSDVASRTGRSIRYTRSNPMYGRVKTVEDLVAFFCAQEQTPML